MQYWVGSLSYCCSVYVHHGSINESPNSPVQCCNSVETNSNPTVDTLLGLFGILAGVDALDGRVNLGEWFRHVEFGWCEALVEEAGEYYWM